LALAVVFAASAAAACVVVARVVLVVDVVARFCWSLLLKARGEVAVLVTVVTIVDCETVVVTMTDVEIMVVEGVVVAFTVTVLVPVGNLARQNALA
jgi:hypothetical protein